MITEATQSDWTNFWEEQPMTIAPIQTVNTLTVDEARHLRDEIIEQIEIAFEVWGEGDCFEQTAIVSLVADTFLDRGVM